MKNIIIKKEAYLLICGVLSLMLGQALSFSPSELGIYDFLSGVFMGLSVPLNIYGIYLAGKTFRNSFQN